MIPKTWNSTYLRENIDIFDFQLSDEEMGEIDTMDLGRCLNYIPYGERHWLPKDLQKWEGFDKWEKLYSPHPSMIHRILHI